MTLFEQARNVFAVIGLLVTSGVFCWILWRAFSRVPWSRETRALKAARREYQRIVDAPFPGGEEYGDEEIAAQVLGPRHNVE